MQLKAGTKLASTVCETQVVVVRAPADEVELGCGGAPLVPADEGGANGTPDPALAEGTLIGKRYADEATGLEVLCTKAGAGSLSIGAEALLQKDAKPLPSSD
jgi:hypothetical protein